MTIAPFIVPSEAMYGIMILYFLEQFATFNERCQENNVFLTQNNASWGHLIPLEISELCPQIEWYSMIFFHCFIFRPIALPLLVTLNMFNHEIELDLINIPVKFQINWLINHAPPPRGLEEPIKLEILRLKA